MCFQKISFQFETSNQNLFKREYYCSAFINHNVTQTFCASFPMFKKYAAEYQR